MIDSFAHDPGAHCGSTSLHDVATAGGWTLPESWCFGFGSGLGFSYYERATSPSRQFVGRTPWLETRFFEHLDVDVEDVRGSDPETAYATLREHVTAGRPGVVFVDIYYLPYFGSDVHFSPHVVVVVDVDDDGVVIADSEFDDLQRVDRDAFEDAWSSDEGFFGPLDRRLLVARDRPTVDVGETPARPMRAGIRQVATGLLDAESAYAACRDGGDGTNGIAGMREMARELPEWRSLGDAEWCTRFAYQNVEKRGTGGAAFRGLFRPFLEDAAEHLEAVTDGDVAEFRGIESEWHEFGDALKRAGLAADDAESQAAYEEASATLFSIADREEALFATLRERLA
jgi:hypothetical protein